MPVVRLAKMIVKTDPPRSLTVYRDMDLTELLDFLVLESWICVWYSNVVFS